MPSAATTRDRDDAVAAAVTSFASGWMATRAARAARRPRPRRPERKHQSQARRDERERGETGTGGGLGARLRAPAACASARGMAPIGGGDGAARAEGSSVSRRRAAGRARASSATTSRRKRAPRQPLERRSRSLVSSLSSSGRRIARRAHRQRAARRTAGPRECVAMVDYGTSRA